MSEETKPELIPLPEPPPEIRLGSLGISGPKEMVQRATVLANALAKIIIKQKLFVDIKGKRFVTAAGWTTMGAMVGVVPIELYCNALPDGKGYKAKVKLVRLNDGMQVGGASAICYTTEKGWDPDDEYATHSKAITRATGKAFRLSYAWIMKLAGFQETPADELFEVEGSKEAAEEVAHKKISEAAAKKANREAEKAASESVFITWPEEHNSHKALVVGRTAILKVSAIPFIEREMLGKWNDRENGWYVTSDMVPVLVEALTAMGCQVIEKKA